MESGREEQNNSSSNKDSEEFLVSYDEIKSKFLLDATTQKWICQFEDCGETIAGKRSSNRIRHFRRKHSEEYVKLAKKTTKKKKDEFFSGPALKVSLTKNEIINACIKIVTVGGKPFSIIDDEGFRMILDPILNAFPKKSSTSINAANIGDFVNLKAEDFREKIRQKIANKLIPLKMDIATRLGRSFLGVNTQLVENGKICLYTLGVIEITGVKHSGENIKLLLRDMFARYEILPGQIFTITVDNGRNMVNSVALLNKEDSAESSGQPKNTANDKDSNDDEWDFLEMSCDEIFESQSAASLIDEDDDLNSLENSLQFDNITCLRCAAHTLQLAVKDSLRGVEKLLNDIRTFIKKLRSPNMHSVLKHLNCSKKPIIDVETRWMSSYDMIKSFLELKSIIQKLAEDDDYWMIETWNEIEILHKSLEPLKTATLKLQNENLVMSDMLKIWNICKMELTKEGSKFSKAFMLNMEAREGSLFQNPVLKACLALDPRLSVELDDKDINATTKYIQKIYSRIIGFEAQENITNQDPPQDFDVCTLVTDDQASVSLPKDSANDSYQQKLQEKRLKKKRVFEEKKNHTPCCAATIEEFIISPPVTSYEEPLLAVWENIKDSYSDLYKVSLVLNSVPATQVSVERLFSQLKYVLNDLRFNLKDKKLENILLIRANKNIIFS